MEIFWLQTQSCNLVKCYWIFGFTDLKGGWTMLSFNFRIRWNAVFKLEIRQLIWLQISNLKWFSLNSMFGSLSCRFPQWGPLFVGIGLTLCNLRLIASLWKCFPCIKLEAVKSPILSVHKCDLLLKILSKVIPVFVYNLMYIQLFCGDWDFYFPVGLSRNYSIFHFFFITEQI